MSHFTVMVIGDNVDAQLQPFHEYECTGIEDQYVVWVDGTEKMRKEWFELKPEERAEYGDDEAQFAKDYYGYEYRQVDGVTTYGRMTNPNAKWDWWVVGGRWSGHLLLKKGAAGNYGERSWTNKDEADDMDRCDQARKGDIDVEGMRAEAVARAEKAWDTVRGVPACDPWMTWEACKAACNQDIEKARGMYRSQSDVVRASEKLGPFADIDSYLMPREQYIERARNGALAQFAYVKDSQWFERGEMGWFACVSDEKDPDAWNKQFNDAFDALPDDTLITIVDCHI